MKGIEISVVMPVFNAELYLDEAIQSVLRQTFRDFEFIIIDDGSTDGSSEIIKKYSHLDPRIRVVTQKNQGLIYSLNIGLRIAKGDFIVRMDADDVSMPERFYSQLNLMKKDGLDLCGCHYTAIDSQGQSQWARVVATTLTGNTIVLSSSVPCAHGSAMIRKSFLLDNDLYYGQTCYTKAEDYALWIKMFEYGARISNVDDFLFKYRILPGSLSSNSMNYKHALKISKYFNNKYSKVVFKVIEVKKLKLNEFELECASVFLYRTLFKDSFFKKIRLLKSIPLKFRIIALLRVVKGF
jgi:glycosyltransferase involved in cell wall biosynthesis